MFSDEESRERGGFGWIEIIKGLFGRSRGEKWLRFVQVDTGRDTEDGTAPLYALSQAGGPPYHFSVHPMSHLERTRSQQGTAQHSTAHPTAHITSGTAPPSGS